MKANLHILQQVRKCAEIIHGEKEEGKGGRKEKEKKEFKTKRKKEKEFTFILKIDKMLTFF